MFRSSNDLSKLITLAVDVTAVIRLTRLVLDDEITSDIRDLIWAKFPPRDTKLGYLFTCPWCVSIWAGFVVFGLRATSPKTADILSGALAASMVTGLVYEKL